MKIGNCIILLLLFSTGLLAQENLQRNLSERSESYYKAKKYDSAYAYGIRSLQLAQQGGNDSLVVASVENLLKYTSESQPLKIDSIYKIGVQAANNTEDPILLANMYYQRGKISYANNDMAVALPFFLKADSLSKKFDFLNETIVEALMKRSEISRTTFTHDGVEAAKVMQLEAMNMAKEIKSERLINDMYLRLADMNGMLGNYEKVKIYMDSAFTYLKSVKNYQRISDGYFTYMNYYYAIEDYDGGGAILKEGIDYFRLNNRKEEMANMRVQYANHFRKRKDDCENAIQEYEKAKALYRELGDTLNRTYMFLAEGLGLCYAETEDFEQAFQNYQQTYIIKRESVKKANNDLSRRLETKYQTQKKEQEIALLTSQNELAEAQKGNQRNIFIAGLAITSLLSAFFFFQYRNRQKTNLKLKELDVAKSTFFANISHEFRTPLTLIKGPLEDQLKDDTLKDRNRQNIDHALSNTKKLESLVDELLALSKLESGNLKLKVQPGNFTQFMVAQADAFAFSAKEKDIEFTLDLESDQTIDWFDRGAMEKVLFNLFGNAIKYTPENGRVAISGNRDGTSYHISVRNTGSFLSEEHRKKIFNRFYQTQDQNPGTGIGLALTKELVELHKGHISVDSNPEGETVFSVSFPCLRNSYEGSEILIDELQTVYEADKSISEELTEASVLTSEEAPIMLIVDDNAEIRDYISSIFENTFKIHQAVNGAEGLELSLQQIPDLIISDVMMPKVDGFTLVEKIKENELTSHIPVILLTAKIEDADKLQGLTSGADAFITKPFSSQLLEATVTNLIATRKKLQQRFAQEVILRPREVSMPSSDQKFIERLQKVFDENLTNSEFSVDACSKEMGVSRMQLHRKIKALTGLSTSKFITGQRLKLAEKLLKTESLSVSEVGYSVGFNDPSYFTKCFKKEYGFSPTDFKGKFSSK